MRQYIGTGDIVRAVILVTVVVSQVAANYQQQQQPQMGHQQAQYQAHPPNVPPQHYGQPMVQGVPQQQMQQQPQHAGVQQHHSHGAFIPQPNQNILHDKNLMHDREHIKEHLHGVLGEPDMTKMSEEELQFHYFKMHDNDNNNKLDGSELIKSLIHWHVEESKHLGQNAPPQGTTKIFTDQELAQMIDPILDMDDKNKDGYIDYAEFVAAQKSRGF
jgi:Ca2+-binding EF-hand superfamily protein